LRTETVKPMNKDAEPKKYVQKRSNHVTLVTPPLRMC